MAKAKKQGPKVLLFDIETAPLLAHVWGLWDNNVGLNQVVKDWHCLSWSAKWLDDSPKKIMYDDQRKEKDVSDDKRLLILIRDLLDEADVVITQNGKKFDQRKLNARFVQNKITPPGSFKHIDTMLIAKKHFDFPSYKLEYMTSILCKKYKKLKHKRFPGHEMWTECLKGNQSAWKEMEKYNKHDVLALEELYHALIPYDSAVNFNLYHEDLENTCKCGNTHFAKNGFYYTNVGKFQKYRCNNKDCGNETRDRENLLSPEKRKSLRIGTVR